MKAKPMPPQVGPLDADTLEALYKESFHWALACCRYDGDEAREVIQITYVKILEGSAIFEGRSTAKTWLFGVIRRTAQERRRRFFLGGLILEKWRDNERAVPRDEEIQDARVEQSERQSIILTKLKQLPARQREVLELVFYQDLTLEEAASVMGVSVGTARTHYERGKKSLRAKLGSELDHEPKKD